MSRNHRYSQSRAATLALAVALAATVAACGQKNEPQPAPAGSVAGALPPPPPPEAAPPPPTSAAIAWPPDALDELLAPIALYPDIVLGQVLTASTNAQEVLDGGNWLLENQALEGDALTAAAAGAGFGPSMQALVHFPVVVDMMCQELDWTTQVGDAVTADQQGVLDSVQRLRLQAFEMGNLESSPQMIVDKTTQDGQEVVLLEPAQPEVVYVPQYDPVQTYTAPAPAAAAAAPVTTTASEPVASEKSGGISKTTAIVGGLLAFGGGILVANLFDDDDDYYYPNYGRGGMYYGPSPYYPGRYVYSPGYPGYRPSPYYRPPTNYPYRYNRPGGNNVNVVNINNSNNQYFNRFEKNQNRVPGYRPSPPTARPTPAVAASKQHAEARRKDLAANARDTLDPATAQAARTKADQVKQQGGYAGARPATGAAAGSQVRDKAGQAKPAGSYAGAKPAAANAQAAKDRAAQAKPAGSYAGAKPVAGNAQAAKDRVAQAKPAGSYAGAKPAVSNKTQAAAVKKPDRGYPQASGQRRDSGAAAKNKGGSAMQGIDRGAKDKAASQRGRASTGGKTNAKAAAAKAKKK